MSFSFRKKLMCDFCHTYVAIDDVDFPEDLYDLIIKYNVQQLYWLCVSCKKKKEQTFSHVLCLAEKQMKMEEKLDELSNTVKKLKQDHLDHSSLSIGYSSDAASRFQEGDGFYLSPDRMGNILSGRSDSTSNAANSESSSSQSLPNAIPQARLSFPDNCKNASEFCNKFVMSRIKISPDQERKSKRIVTDFLDKLTTMMKDTDKLFKGLFQKIYYTGSFYEDLRIKEATEFDINLVLKFPFSTSMRTIEYPDKVKSFAKYKLTKVDYGSKAENFTLERQALCKDVEKNFFENGYLIPEKVKQWMQSMIAKIIGKGMPSIADVIMISDSASGPAKTLKLTTVFGYGIDIDLVPVIEMLPPEWPPGASKAILQKFKVPEAKQFWFLVPKTYAGNVDISPSETARFWRMHFPDVEKEILYNRGMVKPIIKTLKLLRDKQDWKILSSYYLKTVVMWAITENASNEYWKEEHFWDRLILVLKKLQTFVQEMNIPYLFYPSFNLIEKMNKAHADNVRFRLKKVISSLERDYHAIADFI